MNSDHPDGWSLPAEPGRPPAHDREEASAPAGPLGPPVSRRAAEARDEALDRGFETALPAPVAEPDPQGLPALDPTPEPALGVEGTPIEPARSPRHLIEAWLAGMVQAGASDLILRAGSRPSQRLNGRIHFLPGRVPGPGPLLEVLDWLLGERRMEIWRETGSADASLQLDGLGRFRLNAYRQMGEPAVVIRRIRERAPQIDTLNLPAEELEALAVRKRGLVLVTGVAGSGKSTTLAALIEHLNETCERHVVTLEDPVELLFQEKQCVISQREVGTDCTDFGHGLRHALRQSPDVILIGEMRDAETVIAALDAVETGHMVMSTLHTVNGPQTVDRILSFFPAEQHGQVRARLAENLAGVLSQRLLPTADGKSLIPAYELLTSTPQVRELLAEGKTAALARVIEQGTERGLTSFNQCLKRLVVQRKVLLEDALAASDRQEELVLALRGITKSSERTTRTTPGTSGAGGAGGPGRPGRPPMGNDRLRMSGGE